ncbi:DUF3616 domain-containing protein [Methylocystis sp. 9N]|uniref:DUF3616 domain-containing protein n=1 Tax=Methylocystis borbori TaxID=3118750 RepID=A0ABU7XKX5_9HYPH
MIAFPLRRVIIVGSIAGCLCSSAFAVERVKPESPSPWQVSPPAFSKEKQRNNISGVACATDAPDFCLVVTDEGNEAAFIRLTEGKLEGVGTPFPLPVASKEFDAEGATTDGKFFYVVGSHSVKRKSCDDHPANRVVLRFAVDREQRQPGPIKPSGDLWGILENLPEFAGHAGSRACLGDDPPKQRHDLSGRQGVNIEGVAAKDGRLYFGMRGPAIKGAALVVGVDAKALFDGGDAKPSVSRLAVGEKRAIRDLTAAGADLLALVGPDDDERNCSYSIFRIESVGQGAVGARELAVLNLDNAPLSEESEPIKPEAITLLDANSSRYRLLVLSDGGEDGAPLVFDIPR